MQKWNGRRHRPVMKCLMHGGTFKTFNCHSNYKFDAQKISHGSAVNFSVSISVTQIRKTASAAKRVLTCERLSSRQAYAQLGWPSSTRSWDAAKVYYFGSSFGHFTKENEKQFQHLPFAICHLTVQKILFFSSSFFHFFFFPLYFFRTCEMNATMCVHISMWHTTVSQTHSSDTATATTEQPMIRF